MWFPKDGLKRDLHCQSSTSNYIWDKVFTNGPSKICVRQSLKTLKGYGLL